MAQKPQSPLLGHLLSPQGEICTTEYSESMLDDGLILRAPLEQQKWFSDITGLTEQEFRQQIEVWIVDDDISACRVDQIEVIPRVLCFSFCSIALRRNRSTQATWRLPTNPLVRL